MLIFIPAVVYIFNFENYFTDENILIFFPKKIVSPKTVCALV